MTEDGRADTQSVNHRLPGAARVRMFDVDHHRNPNPLAYRRLNVTPP